MVLKFDPTSVRVVTVLMTTYFYTVITFTRTGSISLSPSTSVQFISVALGSSFEHGVNRSSHMTSGVVREGPLTCELQNTLC